MLPLPRHTGTVDGDPLGTLESSDGDLGRSREISGDLGSGRGPGRLWAVTSSRYKQTLGRASLHRPLWAVPLSTVRRPRAWVLRDINEYPHSVVTSRGLHRRECQRPANRTPRCYPLCPHMSSILSAVRGHGLLVTAAQHGKGSTWQQP